jgi:putative NADH-flavin reductase
MNTEKTARPRIVVFGGNGGIGRQVVEHALQRGHPMVAVVRNPQAFAVSHPELTVRKADVMMPETLRGLLEEEDIVISAIGKNSTRETTLYSDGDKHILEAMTAAGAARLFVISASGLEVNPSHNWMIRWVTKNILQRILRHMYADLLRMESLVKASEVQWTIIRPPRLTDGKVTGKYRYSIGSFLKNGTKISRADVAHCMIDAIDNRDFFRNTVEVAY